MDGNRGFFESLFDFSFTSLVTTRLIRVLYILAMILIGIYALIIIGGGFSRGSALGVLAVIGAIIFFFVSVIYLRVILEVLIVIFRIHEHVAEIAQRGQGATATVTAVPPAATPPPTAYTP